VIAELREAFVLWGYPRRELSFQQHRNPGELACDMCLFAASTSIGSMIGGGSGVRFGDACYITAKANGFGRVPVGGVMVRKCLLLMQDLTKRGGYRGRRSRKTSPAIRLPWPRMAIHPQ
jgi:hypothetical protein